MGTRLCPSAEKTRGTEIEATSAQWDTAQFFADGIQFNLSAYDAGQIGDAELAQRQRAIWKAAAEVGLLKVTLAEVKARLTLAQP